MQPDTDALLTNLFEEAPSREFVTAMRGYDRHQVDEHIRQTEADVRQHHEQAQATQRELSEAHRQFHEQERPAYTGLGAVHGHGGQINPAGRPAARADNVVVPEDITPADGDETSPELRASAAANSTAISVRMRRG